jgi:hypothetical protein
MFTDRCHEPDGKGGFVANQEHDGQSTEEHRKGIDYIKSVIVEGQKIRPILALDNEDGTFKRLDGFKRAWAAYELGEKFIEAFVCSKEEYRGATFTPYGNSEIRAWHGGMPHEEFGLFEGGEKDRPNYEDTIFLYKSPNHYGLRVELSECIHVHWGDYGKYRLTLGRKDFEALAEIISQI